MSVQPARFVLLIFTAILMPWFSLQAQTGVTGKVATTGFGFDVTRSLADPLNLRLGFNRLGIVTGYDFDENLRLDLQLESIPVLLDWHLFDNSFRLTGGLFYNRNRFTLSSRSGAQVEINEVQFRVESYAIRVSVDDFSPYLGFGWGRANDRSQRLAFTVDLGILFQGTPSVSGRAVASSPEIQDQLDLAFDAELESRRSDLSDLKLYPVVSLGLSFRF